MVVQGGLGAGRRLGERAPGRIVESRNSFSGRNWTAGMGEVGAENPFKEAFLTSQSSDHRQSQMDPGGLLYPPALFSMAELYMPQCVYILPSHLYV